jgi:hypothetical protein
LQNLFQLTAQLLDNLLTLLQIFFCSLP